MGISVGLVGLGSFGSAFAPLFKRHPLVDRIALCDRESERVARFAQRPDFQDKFRAADAYASVEDICRADLDAVVLMTQPWLHAAQAIQLLESGKHVYSAVPIVALPDASEMLDWCDRLLTACERTGRHYMLGETTVYRPQTMFCRRQAAAGAFGSFVYAEGEYMHPFDLPGCDLRQVQAARAASQAGQEWEVLRQGYRARGIRGTPMCYPTHSVSGPMSVMQAHALKVAAVGFRPAAADPYFRDSAFSNVTALFQMSNGATMRICEYREVAYPGGAGFEHETFRLFGTLASFREDTWMVRDRHQRLTAEAMRDPLPPAVAAAWKDEKGEAVLYGGHGGSHAYLVHEFVDAIASSRRPAIHAWEACRYMAAGCAAQVSACHDGEWTEVADWGDPPA
jgi:predicted dehydrogenase